MISPLIIDILQVLYNAHSYKDYLCVCGNAPSKGVIFECNLILWCDWRSKRVDFHSVKYVVNYYVIYVEESLKTYREIKCIICYKRKNDLLNA